MGPVPWLKLLQNPIAFGYSCWSWSSLHLGSQFCPGGHWLQGKACDSLEKQLWENCSSEGHQRKVCSGGVQREVGGTPFFWVTEKGCAHCLGRDHSRQHEISLRPVSADPGGTCLGTSADGCPKPVRAASPSLKFSNLSELSVSMACGMAFSNWITD